MEEDLKDKNRTVNHTNRLFVIVLDLVLVVRIEGLFDIAKLTSLGGVRSWHVRSFERVGADLKIILTKR